MSSGDLIHVVADSGISDPRKRAGRILIRGSFLILAVVVIAQALDALGYLDLRFTDWQPTMFAYILWAVCLCVGQVVIRGEQGKRVLFVLPSALFVVSLTVIPLFLGVAIAFSDWNLSSANGPRFAGLGNIEKMLRDPFYWNALGNMVWYALAIFVELAIAFGLALLLNAQIRARRFFRVVFLLPLMLSPVAVSWMIGKSMLEFRFGPVSQLARALGWEDPAFFATEVLAKVTMMVLDAWIFIPFMMIMLLAGLQALPGEVVEAARVDGATAWQSFRKVIFPLMLPVVITAFLVRLIFKLKLADIVINITSGGPGGATDTVTSFIYREYRDRSNVGYGTLLAMFYLVIIVICMTGLMKGLNRWMPAVLMTTAAFADNESDLAYRAKWWTSRAFIYAVLIVWAIIALFPIVWTITTSFKMAPDVMQGHLIPFLDYQPQWLGWRSLGLSPDTIGTSSTVRDEFLGRFTNSLIVSVSASLLAVALGSMTGYGLSRFGYKFGYMRNADISFFFISQLILPPVVLALPFLVLYKQLGLLDTHLGLVLLYTLSVMPIVIWIMRDQFMTIPTELEEAALVDGQGVWGAFVLIILPIALPGMVAAFVLSLVLTWNEYFFASLLTSTNAKTLPVMVASQTGSQGISWWTMAAISFAAILPLLIVGVLLERFIIRGMAAGATKG